MTNIYENARSIIGSSDFLKLEQEKTNNMFMMKKLEMDDLTIIIFIVQYIGIMVTSDKAANDENKNGV